MESILKTAFPFVVYTIGILLAFRKLALSSELDAMRGIGIGYGRLLRVPDMLGSALLGWLWPQAKSSRGIKTITKTFRLYRITILLPIPAIELLILRYTTLPFDRLRMHSG